MAGGLAMVTGTLLPWLEVHRPVPAGLYTETGLQLTSGQICSGAAVLVLVGAVATVIPAARKAALPTVAAGAVAAAATATEWSTRLLLHDKAPTAGVAVTGAGVLISLIVTYIAVGGTRWRGALVTVLIVLCCAAVSLAPELPDPVPPFSPPWNA